MNTTHPARYYASRIAGTWTVALCDGRTVRLGRGTTIDAAFAAALAA